MSAFLQKVVIVDEGDHYYETRYLTRNYALRDGWMGFAKAQ